MSGSRYRFLASALWRAIANRPTRIALLIAALTLTAALATALSAVSSGVEARLGEALRAFGANLVVQPATYGVGAGDLSLGDVAGRLDPQVAAHVAAVPGVQSVALRVDSSLAAPGSPVPLVGVDLAALPAGWRLSGSLPGTAQALVGSDVAAARKLKLGSSVPGMPGLTVSGVVQTGGSEDAAVVIPIGRAVMLTGGATSVLVRADPARLAEVAAAIAKVRPDVRVKTLEQVAAAERSLLDKVRMLLWIVTLGVALVCAIAVGNTLSIVVLERTEEIGLLKAIGATRRFVLGYFALEEAAVALAAGFLGLGLGIALAEIISASVFGRPIAVAPAVLPIPFAVALVVVAIAGAAPVWRASGVDASATLKGL